MEREREREREGERGREREGERGRERERERGREKEGEKERERARRGAHTLTSASVKLLTSASVNLRKLLISASVNLRKLLTSASVNLRKLLTSASVNLRKLLDFCLSKSDCATAEQTRESAYAVQHTHSNGSEQKRAIKSIYVTCREHENKALLTRCTVLHGTGNEASTVAYWSGYHTKFHSPTAANMSLPRGGWTSKKKVRVR